MRWLRAVSRLDSVVYGFGTWTIGYWTALAFGLGWTFALGFAVVAGGGVFLLTRRWPTPPFGSTGERADTVPLAVVLAIVIVWPIAIDVGRTVAIVVAIALVVLRVVVPAIAQKLGQHRDLRPRRHQHDRGRRRSRVPVGLERLRHVRAAYWPLRNHRAARPLASLAVGR